MSYAEKSAEVKGAWDEESLCMLSNESGIIGSFLVDEVPVVSGCVPLHPGTPSEVRALTATPSSPALVSASALFTELKEP